MALVPIEPQLALKITPPRHTAVGARPPAPEQRAP